MNYIHIDQLVVPDDRQRRVFDPKPLRDLADSIKSKGLLHPIVVRDDSITLVAGERRYRAIRSLFEAGQSFACGGKEFTANNSLIPVIPLGALSPLEIEEAELEENVVRKDLSWQEWNIAVARLHKLREAQNGKQTQTATAKEVFGLDLEDGGPKVTAVRDAIILSQHLSDPEIALAPDAKTAMKILDKRARAAHNALLATEFKSRRSPHEIIQGSAFELLRTIEGNSIDIIITDPPYGIDADQFGSQADAQHLYRDSRDYGLSCYEEVFRQADRVCKESAFLFAFCDIRIWPDLYQYLGDSWSAWPTPLIWDKGNGMLPVPDKGPRRCYEAIFYAYRGSRNWIATGVSDVLSEPGLQRPEFGAQKPVELYRTLLSRVSRPGDVFLDPFAGTGPVIGAAKALTCKAIVFELSQEKVDFMRATYLKDES